MARRSSKRRSASRRRILQASGMAIDGGGYPSVVPYFHPGPNKKRSRTYPPRYAPPAPPPAPAPSPARAFVKLARRKVQSVVAGTSRHFVNGMVMQRGRKKPVRVSKVLLGPQQEIVRSGAFNFVSTVGQQTHYVVPMMDVSLDFNTSNTLAEAGRELSQALYIASNSSRSMGDATTIVAADWNEAYAKKQRMYLKSHRGQYKMVNTTNAPIKVTIRTFGLKRDTNYQPQQFWDMVARAEDNADNDALSLVGFPPYNNILHFLAPDATPTTLYGFNKLFYQVDKTVVEMDAGAEHKHYMHVEYSRPVRGTDLYAPGYLNEGTDVQSTTVRADSDPTTENKYYLQKYTYFLLITVLGPKVQTSITNTQSYAPGQLSVWYNQNTKFHNYPFHGTTKYFLNEIPITTPAGETYLAMDDQDAGDAAFGPSTV